MIIYTAMGITLAQQIPESQHDTIHFPTENEERIINGDETDRKIFPMAGGMLLTGRVFGSNFDRFVCSSTLIAPDVVLIAAHCIDTEALLPMPGATIRDLQFYWTRKADLTEWDGNTQNPVLPEDAIEVITALPHPDFDMNTLGIGLTENFDIALLFLAEPILDINPAYLPTKEEGETLAVNDPIYVVGWGQQTATASAWGGEPPPPGSYAIKHVGESFISEINSYEIKVGEEEDDVRKCHGDSGGPSFWEAEYGLRLVGVTSHAYDYTDCFQTGGVDTRVDYYLDWIEENMNSKCEDGTRTWCETKGIPPYGYFNQEEEKPMIAACSTTNGSAFWLLHLLALIGIQRRSRLV